MLPYFYGSLLKFYQTEIACNPDLTSPTTIWNIESHTNSLLPSGRPAALLPSFWDSLMEVPTHLWPGCHVY